MADKSKIEWLKGPGGELGASWNPIVAYRGRRRGWFCIHASPGCMRCYAEAMNSWRGNELPYRVTSQNKLRIELDEKVLMQPLHWKQSRKIFPCSMTDHLGSWVEDQWIYRMLAIAALTPQHDYLFLTKREKRLAPLFLNMNLRLRVAWEVREFLLGSHVTIQALNRLRNEWPLKNVWLGVSVEDQERADRRREQLELVAKLGWLTWVSYEPALETVDWVGWNFLKWFVWGGESGPRARPFEVGWGWRALDWCRLAGVPCFVKQMGRNVRVSMVTFQRRFGGVMSFNRFDQKAGEFIIKLKNRKGGDPSEWPEGLRVREFPKVQ